jgi:hypothetical protein
MARGKLNRDKQVKLGELPGDISIGWKITMLEKKNYLDGNQPEELGFEIKQAKSYRKRIAEKAKRRFRNSEEKEIANEILLDGVDE